MTGIMDSRKLTKKIFETLQLVRPEFRVKPHIRKWGKSWECVGHGYSSLGFSPKDAYDNWCHYGAILRSNG
jgi:hypothetical protein